MTLMLSLSEYRRTALAAMLIALLITVGMTFVFIPNLELIIATAFLAGFLLGPRWGWWVAGLGEALFSAMNPIGSGLAFPVLYAFQIMAITFTGFVGGVFSQRQITEPLSKYSRMGFGFLGGGLAMLYDFLTTLSFPLTAGIGGWSLVTAAVLGLGYFVIHIVSNFIIFSTILPGMMILGRRQLMVHGLISHV